MSNETSTSSKEGEIITKPKLDIDKTDINEDTMDNDNNALDKNSSINDSEEKVNAANEQDNNNDEDEDDDDDDVSSETGRRAEIKNDKLTALTSLDDARPVADKTIDREKVRNFGN